MTSLIKIKAFCKSFIHPFEQIRHLWPIIVYAYRTESHQQWLFRVMHPQPHSFLGTGTRGHDLHCRKDEGQQCVCVCAPVQQWHSGKLTMSVSDLITDLPPCSPLIFDGPGQWKGHRVVLRDLAQNDSMVCLNPIENCVSHITNAYWEFPLFPSSWFQADADKRQQHNFILTLTEQILSEGTFLNVNVCDLNTVNKYSCCIHYKLL